MSDRRVAYLPLRLSSMLPFRFKHLSSEDIDKFTDLLAEAFGQGYDEGYTRGLAEESGRASLKQREHLDPPSVFTQEEKEGDPNR